MRNNFKQYFAFGLLLASLTSFLFTNNVSLSLEFLHFLIFILIFCICTYLDIIIHEFGHAIAGWMVKIPIKRITIGLGHNIFKYKFNQTTLVVNEGIQGGLTHPGTLPGDFLRLRYFFFVLGGVGLQAIAIALFAAILVSTNTFHLLTLSEYYLFSMIVHCFFLSNFLLIFVNLLPFNANMMGIPMPTDGLQLLTIFFKSQEQIQELLLSGKILEGLEHMEEKNFQEAELIFRECILKNPTFLIPKLNLSSALVRQQKVDEAIGLLSELLTELDRNPRRLIVLNNLAWSYLLKGLNQPEFLNQADEYSAQAIAIANQAPAVVGTRACVLIEIGEVDAGIKLLKDRVSLNHAVNETTNSVISFLYLAYAYYLKGNGKFQKYLQKINNNEDLKFSEYKLLFDHVLEKTNCFAMQ